MVAGNVKTPLNKEELQHLENVIGELEKKTSGEIRLVIVQKSMPFSYRLISDVLVIALIGMWLERHLLLQYFSEAVLLALVVGASVALGALFSRVPVLVRMFNTANTLREYSLLRAELEFYREGLGATAGKTGILLFLSMNEHQAVVLADKGIAAKLEPKIWNEVVETMLEGPKTGLWASSLEKALRRCGMILAEHFPAGTMNRDELPNLVIVKP